MSLEFYTCCSQWVQFGYFFLAFLRDIMPDSYARQLLTQFCDFVFTAIAFPLSTVSLEFYRTDIYYF